MYQLRKKKLADTVVIYGRGRELFRPPTYGNIKKKYKKPWLDRTKKGNIREYRAQNLFKNFLELKEHVKR